MKTCSETQEPLSANTVLQARLLLLGAWIAQRERMHWLVRQSAPLAQQGRTIRQPAANLYPYAPLAQKGRTIRLLAYPLAPLAKPERTIRKMVKPTAPLAKQGRTIRRPAATLHPLAPPAQWGPTIR